jgi:phosphate transport system substrate-binding protein
MGKLNPFIVGWRTCCPFYVNRRKTMKKLFWSTLLILLTLPAQGAAEELRYVGSSTIGTSILEAEAAAAFTKNSGIKFTAIEQIGSGRGIQAVLEGKTSLAGASRPLKTDEKKAKLIGTNIGYDAIAVFVHGDNPVKNLTKEQLKGIFTGAITNWREVGGKDAPITPNVEILTGKRATVEMVQELVLDGAAYGRGFKEVDLPRDQIIDLAANSNGICTVSIGLLAAVPADVRGKVKAISVNNIEPNENNVRSGAYLISRPLVLVTLGLPKGAAKDFISFMLSPEGQAIVAKNFVAVRR